MEKVAIINTYYEYGSTGTLTKQLFKYGNANGYEPFVFFGRGAKPENDHIIRIDGRAEIYIHKLLTLLTGYQGYFSNSATQKLIAKLKQQDIKKAILLNLHGYYLNERKLLEYLRDNNIRTAYVTPDEYAGLGRCCFSKGCDRYKTRCGKCPQLNDYPKSPVFDRSQAIFDMKKEAYSGFDTMTLLGPESNLEIFRESVLVKDKSMRRVSWGVDLALYKNETDDTLYDKYNIPRDKVIIITVARYSDPRKLMRENFFDLAKSLENTGYHFINVGYDGNLAPDELPKNITTIGYTDDQRELARLYSLSDLYLVTSTTETMPISALISFACETPVCCFYSSGLKYLADRSSPAIRYVDEISRDALTDAIRKTGKKTTETMKACRALAAGEYSIEAFNKKVYEAIEG